MLSPANNKLPDTPHHIHLMGICGTGMASLAGILKEKGYLVTGSDSGIYPPMSDFLKSLSIAAMEGYGPGNLHPLPDLVIVGNVITRENPEVKELARLEIPYLSFPQALKHFAFAGKLLLVVAGTHGKTTTSALLAWILEKAGMAPGFMIGGIPGNFRRNFKLGQGPYFVIEGDEYDTAFFDKGPKFLHYDPWALVITSIEFDHADIYRDLEHIVLNFEKLVNTVPQEGILISNADDPITLRLSKKTGVEVVTYSLSGKGDWGAQDISFDHDFTRLKLYRRHERAGSSCVIESVHLVTPLYGRHNISNLLGSIALAHNLGIPFNKILEAVLSFRGVKRRQEVVGEKKGIIIIDDFAHHPSAVRETLNAVKEKYRGQRLIAAFEPRSNTSRRKVFQSSYASSFDKADLIMIPEPPMMDKVPPEERFSSRRLVKDLQARGIKASYFENTDLLLESLLQEGKEGDIILIMSNGAFDNLPYRLLKRL